MFEDQILLKLKRKYSKDEEMKFVLKRLTDEQVENGILKSEVAEWKDKYNKLKHSLDKDETRPKKEWLKEDVIKDMTEKIKKLELLLTEKRKNAEEWQRKYFSIINQVRE